jgi:hypothetical protein
MPTQLERALGHPLAQVSPAEVTLMRAWITAMKDGDATWGEIEAAQAPQRAGTDDAPTPAAGGTASLRERMTRRKDRTETPAADIAPDAAPTDDAPAGAA